MLEAEDFDYSEDTHTYRANGMVVPSVTQVLKRCGVINYDGVPAPVLEKARLRGQLVHDITAEVDRTGWIPWDWCTEDSRTRMAAYIQFLADFRGRIEFTAIEVPTVKPVAGMLVGGTPDRIMWIDGRRYILDIKNSAKFEPAWKLQTALYEMQETGQQTCGLMGRLILQLLPNGRYKTTECSDACDGAAAVGLLAAATWMMREGIY